MARTPRKKKLKPMEKLWEVPIEVLQLRIEKLERKFPTSAYLQILKLEVARTDRSGPMRLDDEDSED